MNDQTGVAVFSDEDREQCIDIMAQLAVNTSGGVRKYFWHAMKSLQAGRSAEQIERIEREKGLRE